LEDIINIPAARNQYDYLKSDEPVSRILQTRKPIKSQYLCQFIY